MYQDQVKEDIFLEEIKEYEDKLEAATKLMDAMREDANVDAQVASALAFAQESERKACAAEAERNDLMMQLERGREEIILLREQLAVRSREAPAFE